MSEAVEDVPGIESQHFENDPDQDRQQDKPKEHGQRWTAEKPGERAKATRMHGVFGHGRWIDDHGASLSRDKTRCSSTAGCLNPLQYALKGLQAIRLARRLVPAQPVDARKPHGHARFVAGRSLQTFERDFQDQALLRLMHDLAHWTKTLHRIAPDETIDLNELPVGEPEI